LSLTPASATIGQSVVLEWETTNADSVTISGIGNVEAPRGSRTVPATADTTYQLTATGAGGSVTASASLTVKPLATLQNSVNHIIMVFQENRGFDHYFGKLNKYRAKLIQERPELGIPACTVEGVALDPSKALASPNCVDGLPDDDSTVKKSPCDGFKYCNRGRDGSLITPFPMISACSTNLTPSWNESHRSYNLNSPSSETPRLNGFATVQGGFANALGDPDIAGERAMGYYDEKHLPYYYFLATTFATSDRWFCPLPSRSQPNRIFGLAATTRGLAHSPKPGGPSLPKVTIFDLLQKAGVTWKVYTSSGYSARAGRERTGATFMNYFPISTRFEHFAPIEQYFTDLQTGNLAQVVLLESGYATGEDEHPQNNIQTGAAYMKRLVDALMNTQYWKDSVLFLTYDEGGGFYDHVAPMKAVIPDNFATPVDLAPGDVQGAFNRTGFRVPLLVISPFTKKGYVSHTEADFTALNKFIAARFLKDPVTGAVPSLTKRDAAQFDMTEFFDFQNPPWLTPPTGIPEQATFGTTDHTTPIGRPQPCYYHRLP
jgi:phospholipase C